MKQKISTPIVVAIIVFAVGIASFFIYHKTTNPYAGGDAPAIPMKVDLNAGPQQMSLPTNKDPSASPKPGGMGGGMGGMTTPPGMGGTTAPGMGGMMAPPPGK